MCVNSNEVGSRGFKAKIVHDELLLIQVNVRCFRIKRKWRFMKGSRACSAVQNGASARKAQGFLSEDFS